MALSRPYLTVDPYRLLRTDSLVHLLPSHRRIYLEKPKKATEGRENREMMSVWRRKE